MQQYQIATKMPEKEVFNKFKKANERSKALKSCIQYAYHFLITFVLFSGQHGERKWLTDRQENL